MSHHGERFAQATLIGDSDPPRGRLLLAEGVGALLAKYSITLITGGRGGVMEAASRGAARAGGTTVGILPSEDMTEANSWCQIVIPTGLGHARNVVTALAGDFVIAVGGGAGTLSEICFAWLHRRPIFVVEGSGGWADKLAGQPLDHRASSTIVPCKDLMALEISMVSLCAERGLRIRS